MPKYHVHVYPVVVVFVPNIEADSKVEACKKAETAMDWDRFAERLGLWYADKIDGFLVDEDGDTEHANSTFYDAEYHPDAGGATVSELLAALEGLLEWESRMGGWDAPCWEQARAAIAKASPQAP